jgi:hypothetical protein
MNLLTFGIFIRAGKAIYHNRNQLQNLSSIDHHRNLVENMLDVPMSKVTEIRITSEVAGLRPENSRQRALYSPYTVIVGSGDMPEGPASPQRLLTEPMDANGHRRSPKSEATASDLAYFKYAMLYFVALLVTWVSPLAHIYAILERCGH